MLYSFALILVCISVQGMDPRRSPRSSEPIEGVDSVRFMDFEDPRPLHSWSPDLDVDASDSMAAPRDVEEDLEDLQTAHGQGSK